MNSLQQNPDIHYWLHAHYLTGIGPVTMTECLTYFKTMRAFFSATPEKLVSLGFNSQQIKEITQPNFSKVEADIAWCKQNSCFIMCRDDPRYPSLLKQLPDAPLVLFVRGDVQLLNKPQLAMVGSRNPSVYGREMAEQFAWHLAQADLAITSGLALGIDTACHKGALRATGKTIAVLGSGHAAVYPPSNRRLAEDIVKHGALVSEFAPHEPPRSFNFPRRNRIISGLSLGVFVVEAAVRSGSLITARFAVEQGREVFAAPGSIHNALSKGCHVLIRQGAKLVETANDILEELGSLITFSTETDKVGQTPEKQKCDVKSMRLLAEMAYEVTSLDVIIHRSGLTASEVSSMLLSLELLGYVQHVPGGYVKLTNI